MLLHDFHRVLARLFLLGEHLQNDLPACIRIRRLFVFAVGPGCFLPLLTCQPVVEEEFLSEAAPSMMLSSRSIPAVLISSFSHPLQVSDGRSMISFTASALLIAWSNP